MLETLAAFLISLWLVGRVWGWPGVVIGLASLLGFVVGYVLGNVIMPREDK